jgi:hypothetical protein
LEELNELDTSTLCIELHITFNYFNISRKYLFLKKFEILFSNMI